MDTRQPAEPTTELARLVDQLGAVIDALYALAFELRTITRDTEAAAADGARLELVADTADTAGRHPANGHRYCANCRRYL